jgi:uncharacterized protein YcfJ
MSTIDPKTALDNIKNLKSPDLLKNKTKATINGAFIGMVGGAMIGYYKGYNVFLSAMVGAFSGGLISNLIVSPKKSEEDGW